MDDFAGCFGREAQRDAARRYVRGLLSASERKSIQAMSAGRSNAEYQRVHHFISEAPWNGAEIWRRVRMKAIDRSGVIVIDDTGFAKQGPRSVAVARQYCPPLGKVANCQVAVTSVLRSSRSTWLLGMDLYVPQDWIDDPERRERALVPESVVAKKKWELALGQIGRAKREGFEILGIAADAGYGDVGAFRDGIAKLGLRYVVRCGGRQVAFLERPRFSNRESRTRKRVEIALARGSAHPMTLKQIAASLPDRCFRRVTWGKGSKGPMRIRVTALRILLAPRATSSSKTISASTTSSAVHCDDRRRGSRDARTRHELCARPPAILKRPYETPSGARSAPASRLQRAAMQPRSEGAGSLPAGLSETGPRKAVALPGSSRPVETEARRASGDAVPAGGETAPSRRDALRVAVTQESRRDAPPILTKSY